MNPSYAKIITTLKQAELAIKTGDSFQLKKLSSVSIKDASLMHDTNFLTLTIALYALSKVIEKISKKRVILQHISKATIALEKGDEEKYRRILKALLDTIKGEDSKLRHFVTSVIEQARVKKGCDLCSQGYSIGQVSGMLEISKWELMEYLGKTKVIETSTEKISTEKRLLLARSIFT